MCHLQVPEGFVNDVREEWVQEKTHHLRTCLLSAECSRGLFAIQLPQILKRIRPTKTQKSTSPQIPQELTFVIIPPQKPSMFILIREKQLDLIGG